MVDPFFPTTKKPIASFLQAVNVGISTTPTTTLTILQQHTPIAAELIEPVPDIGVHSGTCPPISPRSVGIVCPVLLYAQKCYPQHGQNDNKC